MKWLLVWHSDFLFYHLSREYHMIIKTKMKQRIVEIPNGSNSMPSMYGQIS